MRTGWLMLLCFAAAVATMLSDPAAALAGGGYDVRLQTPTACNAGSSVVVTIDLTAASAPNVAGGQFFLSYDTSRLSFVSATAGFGLRTVYLSTATPGEIDYAVGIVDGGPSVGPQSLATVTFARVPLGPDACASDGAHPLVRFRVIAPPFPPSRLTDAGGISLPGTALFDLAPFTLDRTAPVISCPANIGPVGTSPMSCDYTLSPAQQAALATATDACSTPTISYVRSDGASLLLSDPFPAGVTTITWTATDACGNHSSCNSTVTVVDLTAPSISSCGTDVTVTAGAGCQAPVPNFAAAVSASDNCTPSGSLVITQSPLSGTLVGTGTTVVTITVKDAANNQATRQRNFTVNTDISAPLSASVLTPTICANVNPTITLSASGGFGGTLRWYSDSCGGTLVGTGTPLTIAAPSSTTTYFARWEGFCGVTSCVFTTVNVVPQPTANAGGPYTICADGVVIATGTATNASSVQWITSGDGIFTSPTTSGTLYHPGPMDIAAQMVTLTFKAFPNAPCVASVSSAAVVTINPLPIAPTSASVDHPVFCAGSFPSITLSSMGGSGAKLRWTSGSCGGPLVGAGPSLTIPAPATTTTYFAAWVNSCGSSACVSVMVTVNQLPTAPSVATPADVCTGFGTTLSGTVGPDETIDWYTGTCGGTFVGTGTLFPVTPATTTTYYARARNTLTGCISATCGSATVTVNPLPATPIAGSGGSICSGSSFMLSASHGAGEAIDWFTGSCGGTAIGSGDTLSVSPLTTTTYYARARNTSTGCVSASCAAVVVNVTTTPTSPASASVNTPTYCTASVPATISLSATGGVGGTYHWYSASCGSGPVGTGSPLVIAAPTSTTTYYVRREDGACFSPSCVSVTVTVNSSPVAPTSASVDQPSFCEGAFPTITLTAPGGSGDVLKWYSAACGGTPVGVGSPLVITSPIVSTTYFARWESILCGNSSCESVAVHVDPSAHAPTSITASANNYCAGSVTSLTLTAVAGSGSTLEWFDTACGGTVIGTGNPLVITAPITTTTYSARYVEPVCGPSTCASLIITVNPVTGACCTGWGTQKVCQVVAPINCQGVTTPTLAYRGNCTTCGTPFCCGADFNNNGHIEVQDIFDFLDAWFQQVQPSDFNHDGFKNVQDIFDFLSAWFAGC